MPDHNIFDTGNMRDFILAQYASGLCMTRAWNEAVTLSLRAAVGGWVHACRSTVVHTETGVVILEFCGHSNQIPSPAATLHKYMA